MTLYPFHLVQKRCYNESVITFDNIIDEAPPYYLLFFIGFTQNYLWWVTNVADIRAASPFLVQ
jgi:hypothetical protein